MALEHRHIETGEVEQLCHLRVGEHALEVGGFVFSGGELHRMADAIARRHLRQAQPVAEGIEAQRLGVDGNQRAEVEAVRQVVLIELDPHKSCIAHG